jgi:hypothetical protein
MISSELQERSQEKPKEKSKEQSGTGISKDVISKVRPFYSALTEDPFEVRTYIRTPNTPLCTLKFCRLMLTVDVTYTLVEFVCYSTHSTSSVYSLCRVYTAAVAVLSLY